MILEGNIVDALEMASDRLIGLRLCAEDAFDPGPADSGEEVRAARLRFMRRYEALRALMRKIDVEVRSQIQKTEQGEKE